jgi:hypothetical protein
VPTPTVLFQPTRVYNGIARVGVIKRDHPPPRFLGPIYNTPAFFSNASYHNIDSCPNLNRSTDYLGDNGCGSMNHKASSIALVMNMLFPGRLIGQIRVRHEIHHARIRWDRILRFTSHYISCSYPTQMSLPPTPTSTLLIKTNYVLRHLKPLLSSPHTLARSSFVQTCPTLRGSCLQQAPSPFV